MHAVPARRPTFLVNQILVRQAREIRPRPEMEQTHLLPEWEPVLKASAQGRIKTQQTSPQNPSPPTLPRGHTRCIAPVLNLARTQMVMPRRILNEQVAPGKRGAWLTHPHHGRSVEPRTDLMEEEDPQGKVTSRILCMCYILWRLPCISLTIQSSFTFPIDDETFVRTSDQMRPPSTANINTNFSASDPPLFFSGAPPPSVSTTGTPVEQSATRGRSPDRNNQPSTFGAEGLQSQNFAHGSSAYSRNNDLRFSADTWAKDLKDQNWASQWTTGTSPSRNNASPKRAKASSSRYARSREPSSTDMNGDADLSQTINSSSKDGFRRESQGSAMDIDPEPPSGSATGHAGPRQTYAQPDRPGLPTDAERRPSYPNLPANLPGPPPGPPPVGAGFQNPLDLNDLRNVAPLSGATSGGINNMADLSSGLPFPSQPSTVPPSSSAPSPTTPRLELPKPPKGPFPPLKMTQEYWNPYIVQLTAYNSAWNLFNMQMVSLIHGSTARLMEMDNGPAGGMVDGWLGAIGETSSLGGWETYQRHLKDDERIRTYWTVASEKHLEVMERHGSLRKQAQKNGVP